MSKYKLKKAVRLQGINGYQPNIFWDEKKRVQETCQYWIDQVQSDTPPEATPNTYPYMVVEHGVKLHDIFQPLFEAPKMLYMSKREADYLCSTEIGFDKRSGHPCRIIRNGNETSIVIYPSNNKPYLMDCLTGKGCSAMDEIKLPRARDGPFSYFESRKGFAVSFIPT